jgi:hypothetical protein
VGTRAKTTQAWQAGSPWWLMAFILLGCNLKPGLTDIHVCAICRPSSSNCRHLFQFFITNSYCNNPSQVTFTVVYIVRCCLINKKRPMMWVFIFSTHDIMYVFLLPFCPLISYLSHPELSRKYNLNTFVSCTYVFFWFRIWFTYNNDID